MVCGFATTTLKGSVVASEDNNSGRGLEIAMRLHETPMQDPNLGVQQIHAELNNLCLEMQSLKQDRIV